ncbi:arginyl-tRNA--protein transferase 2-like isoform X2 [Cynara cardunculus var. scolymus]|uniref:arginyl-tRNA--protein transferase 2-like isoform X2 n=1 Tax=Cynara cardunculus var. scolymus TaxID=59895 RepID=UPI000D63022D|nr:arginyl-tRNA--protein transferase 2-like isoform X2 [Cynara cardunculus var. scolymus]
MADEKMIRSEASSSRSNSNNGRGESVVFDVGRGRRSCGYCKSSSYTSITHDLRAHSLTVYDYQGFLDKGWRRAGCLLYKPEMEKTCCPSYTIRLKASDFVPSKEQVRVAKRMQRFIDGTLNVKKPCELVEIFSSTGPCNLSNSECRSSVHRNFLADNGVQKNILEQVTRRLSDQIDSVVHTCIKQEDLLYSSNISFQIAAALRRANKDADLSKSTDNCTEKSNRCRDPNPKFIADELSSHLSNLVPAFGFSIKACNGHINFYSTEIQAQPDVVVGKASISKDSSTGNGNKSCSLDFAGKFQAKGPNLEIRMKKSSFDPEEYALYKRYQIQVHNDAPNHVTESSYKRFLVDSPLVFVPSSRDSTSPPCGFGSFHQQYLINGKLVAVGVIDILPRCLSSKYLFWDPDLAFLSLGKYSALQEINWVLENEGHCPSLQYYYLGYYIHSCNKMRYKAAYRPSELLCPLRYQWVPYDIAKRLLDRKPYVVLSDFATLQNEEPSSHAFEENMGQEDEPCPEESNDIPIDDDEEMSEIDFEHSDDGSEPETTAPTETRKEDISNDVIGLNGMHKDTRDPSTTVNIFILPAPAYWLRHYRALVKKSKRKSTPTVPVVCSNTTSCHCSFEITPDPPSFQFAYTIHPCL